MVVIKTAKDTGSMRGELTSSNRFASGCTEINWLILPFVIHSDIMANRPPVMSAPLRGTTFGCRRNFQVRTLLQNVYKTYTQFIDEQKGKSAKLSPSSVAPGSNHLGANAGLRPPDRYICLSKPAQLTAEKSIVHRILGQFELQRSGKLIVITTRLVQVPHAFTADFQFEIEFIYRLKKRKNCD